MRIARVLAADKGVQRIQPMHQVRIDQEFQRPVDGWRCDPLAIVAEGGEDIVGAHRLVAVPDQFQYAPASLRQPEALVAAHLVRSIQGAPDTFSMIVGPGFGNGLLAAAMGVALS